MAIQLIFNTTMFILTVKKLQIHLSHASNWLFIHVNAFLRAFVSALGFWRYFALSDFHKLCLLQWVRILEVKKDLDNMQGRDERESQVESNRRT